MISRSESTSVSGSLVKIEGGISLDDQLRPYVRSHDSEYDCTFLETPYIPRKKACEIAYVMALRFSSLKLGKNENYCKAYYRIKRFFKWLNYKFESSDSNCFENVKRRFVLGEKPRKIDWQNIVVRYIEDVMMPSEENIITKANAVRTKISEIDDVRPFIKIGAVRGIWPDVVMKSPLDPKKHSSRRKTIGDLYDNSLNEQTVKRLLGSKLNGIASGDPVVESERRACFRAIASSGISIAGLNDAEIIEKIQEVNEERLQDIREAAEDELLYWWDKYKDGMELIESCDLSYEKDIKPAFDDFHQGLLNGIKSTSAWYKNHPLRVMFGGPMVKSDTNRLKRKKLNQKIATARLLVLVDNLLGMSPYSLISCKYIGIIPMILRGLACQALMKNSDEIENSFYNSWLRNRLVINTKAILAAQFILLIDTGMNVSVVDYLPYDCVKETDHPEIKKIWGWKDRANGVVVESLVRLDDGNRLNAVQVVEIMREMTRRHRKLATKEHSLYTVKVLEKKIEKYLFVRDRMYERNKREEGLVLDVGLSTLSGGPNGAVASFRKKYEKISSYEVKREFIRPTVLLLKFMKGDLNIEISKIEAAHNSKSLKTTSGYVVRTMSRMVLEQRIREFQNSLEAIMIQDIPKAAELLGFTEEEYKERLIGAQRTGLGSICQHLQKGSGGEKSSKKPNCIPIEDCPSCPLMRVVPASFENLVDAFIHNNYLIENEKNLISQNPDRWRKVHLPWMALTLGVIEKAKKSPMVSRTMFLDAQEKAKKNGSDAFISFI